MHTVEQAVKKMLEANSRIRRIDGKEMEAFLCNNRVIFLIQASDGMDVYTIKGKQKYKFTLQDTEENNERIQNSTGMGNIWPRLGKGDTEKEAIEIALGPECPLPEGNYVDDSIRLDEYQQN